MATENFIRLVGGRPKAKPSTGLSPTFLSVLVGATGLEIKETAGAFDFSTKNLTNMGTVDGRTISADGAALDGHLAAGAGKHADTDISYSRLDASKKNIAALSDDVGLALNDLDDAIGALAQGTNYSATDPAITSDHLAGIDTALGLAGTGNVKSDGTVPFTSDQSMGGNKLTNLAAGIASTDAVNFAQLSAAFNNLDRKNSVQLVATTNVALTGEQTIDGSLTSATRVLLVGQTIASENGIYDTSAGAWTRATDADASAEVTSGLQTTVSSGTAKSGSMWLLTTADPIVLGTTALTFTELSINFIVAGDGASLVGDTISVSVSALIGNGLIDDGSNNFTIKLDAATLALSAAGLKVADGGIAALQIASAAVDKTKLNADVVGVGLRQNPTGAIERDDFETLTNDNASAVPVRSVVFKTSATNFDLAGNAVASLADKQLGIVTESAGIGIAGSGEVATRHGARISGFASLVVGNTYYVSATLGGITNDVSLFGSGTTIYPVGRAITSSVLEFIPGEAIEIQ